MNYLDVCAGLSAASVAWAPLGWRAHAFAEIDAFPCAVLSHHYPHVPNLGDMTGFSNWPNATLDILVAGTPCQAFSIAGLRRGLVDPRGNLTLAALAIVARYRPRWFCWENVHGVLSSWTDAEGEDGVEVNAFDCFLGGLAQLGYGFAYRVLDAVHFGTPHLRRRIYLVASSVSWQASAAVLFDRAAIDDVRAARAGVPCLDASGLAKKQTMPERGRCWTVHDGHGHRFLTPVECERLFGFPDDYTSVPYRNKPVPPDGPRYKALGNSMHVPTMRWIGERMALVDARIAA
jgi:DNA (cytosine-5)-methyltransferase 1